MALNLGKAKKTAEPENQFSSGDTVRFNGKVTALPEVTESGKAVKLSYKTDKGRDSNAFIPVSRIEKNKTLETLLETLVIGDDLTLSFKKGADGKFEGLQSVVKGRLMQKAAAPQQSADYVLGQIKGNTVTKAIDLSIADKDTSEENIRKNVLKVLRTHGFTEALDIRKEMAKGKNTATTIATDKVPKVIVEEEHFDEDLF